MDLKSSFLRPRVELPSSSCILSFLVRFLLKGVKGSSGSWLAEPAGGFLPPIQKLPLKLVLLQREAQLDTLAPLAWNLEVLGRVKISCT